MWKFSGRKVENFACKKTRRYRNFIIHFLIKLIYLLCLCVFKKKMIKVLKLLLRFFFEGNNQLQLREMLSLKKKKMVKYSRKLIRKLIKHKKWVSS